MLNKFVSNSWLAQLTGEVDGLKDEVGELEGLAVGVTVGLEEGEAVYKKIRCTARKYIK